jgi:hypothetical protein
MLHCPELRLPDTLVYLRVAGSARYAVRIGHKENVFEGPTLADNNLSTAPKIRDTDRPSGCGL